jgi:hypothetical protein
MRRGSRTVWGRWASVALVGWSVVALGVTRSLAQVDTDSVERMQRMPVYSTALGEFLPGGPSAQLGTWSYLGPGNVGGRTRALAFHPSFTANQTLYAGAAGGGVWRSTDAGGSWLALFSLTPWIQRVSTLALSPADPATIYAGTGQGFEGPDAVGLFDIYKTTDAGATWQPLPDHVATTGVRKLAVSSLHPSNVYAATNLGLWRSTNAGGTWTRLLTPGFNPTNISFDGCVDVVVRSGQSEDDVFAACGLHSSTGSNNQDAAVFHNAKVDTKPLSWTRVLSHPSMGRASLAIAPGDQATIYALLANDDTDDVLGVHRSTDGGVTWTLRHGFAGGVPAASVGDLLLSRTEQACGGTTRGMGRQVQSIAVDPLNADRVWVGGVRLFRSDDGGSTWGSVDPRSGSGELIHSADHVIAFPPDYDGVSHKSAYVANDGGIWRVDDALATTTPNLTGANSICDGDVANTFGFTNLNHTYGVTQFHSGAVFPSDDRYFGGTQGNGTVLGSDSAGPEAWTTILGAGGDAGAVAVDPTNSDILYASGPGGSLQKSTDGGVSFQSAVSGIFDSNFLPVAPLAMDPSDPQRLWTAGGAIWRSTNGGASWSRASTVNQNDVDDVDSAGAIAVAPTNPNHVLVGGGVLGRIYRSTNALSSGGSTTWPSTYVGGDVSSIVFDPTDENRAFAAGAGAGISASTDGGVTWTRLENLPSGSVHSLVIDSAGRLYAGSDYGVYVSLDGGYSWAVENTGFSRVVTRQLVLNGATLYAFTHGRGVWRVSVPPPPPPPSMRINDVSLLERNAGSQTAVFTVRLSAPATRPVTVQYATADGSATAGEDYAAVSGMLSFGRGTTTASIAVPVSGDTKVEGAETFNVTLSAPVNATLADDTGVGTILNDDTAGFFRLSAARYTLREVAPFALITVLRDEASPGSTATIDYRTIDGSATAPADYTAVSGTLSFGLGVQTQTIKIPITKDSEFEPTEVLGIKLQNPSAGAQLLSYARSALISITDDDPVPFLQIGAAAYTVSEGGAGVTVSVRRLGSTSVTSTVDYTTVDATATAGSDYTVSSGTLSFEPGATTKSITIPIADDAIYEPAETFKVVLQNPGHAALRPLRAATVTIRDNDQGLSFSSATYSVVESARKATITVKRSGGVTGQLTVDYAVTGGSATAGVDYVLGTGTLIFNPGVLTRSFSVDISNDSESEGGETIELALLNASPATAVTAPASAVLTIVDDEPTFRFAAPSSRVSELTSKAAITVLRSGPATAAAAVDYAVTGGTATGGGVDYTLASGTLVFGVGVVARTIPLNVNTNTTYEPDETVILTLQQHPGSLPIGTPGTTTVTLLDANTAGTAQFSAEVYGTDPATGEALILISRFGGNADNSKVVVTPGGGTAQAGVDYTASPVTVTFPYAGTSFEAARIPVFATGTGSKYFNVQLSSTTGVKIGAPAAAVVWILD